MEDVMLCYILQRLHRPQFQNVTIYLSGSRDPGEGELKIVDWANAIMPSPTDSLIICGSDSDLVIQAIGFPNISNLTVFQNNGEKQDMFCDIYRAVELIQRDLYSRKFKETKIKLPEITKADRLDYILLFILNGNDYLPKIRGITFHKILDAYSKVVLRSKESLYKNLVNFEGRTFNFPLLYQFCKALSKEEMYTPSPVQIIPSCTEAFCSFAQKR
jgi:5'-3' exonuclease